MTGHLHHAVDPLTSGCYSLTAPVPEHMDCATAAWARSCPEPGLGALSQRQLIWQVLHARPVCAPQHACTAATSMLV